MPRHNTLEMAVLAGIVVLFCVAIAAIASSSAVGDGHQDVSPTSESSTAL